MCAVMEIHGFGKLLLCFANVHSVKQAEDAHLLTAIMYILGKKYIWIIIFADMSRSEQGRRDNCGHTHLLCVRRKKMSDSSFS